MFISTSMTYSTRYVYNYMRLNFLNSVSLWCWVQIPFIMWNDIWRNLPSHFKCCWLQFVIIKVNFSTLLGYVNSSYFVQFYRKNISLCHIYFIIRQKLQFIFYGITLKAFSNGSGCSGVGVLTTYNQQGMCATTEFRDSFAILKLLK